MKTITLIGDAQIVDADDSRYTGRQITPGDVKRDAREFSNSCAEIVAEFAAHGYAITAEQAAAMWKAASAGFSASFLCTSYAADIGSSIWEMCSGYWTA